MIGESMEINWTLGVFWYGVFVLSTTLHEAAHAFVAFKFGDKTAYHAGQVSLDPSPHMRREPFGMILLPILSFLFYGWMIGWASAPYNLAWSRSNPRKAAIMALAGPLSNLLLVVITGFVIRFGIKAGWFFIPDYLGMSRIVDSANGVYASNLASILSIAFSLNLILFVFNLIPLPPLDGSSVLYNMLSGTARVKYEMLNMQPFFRIIGIVMAWNFFDMIFPAIRTFALKVILA